MNNKVDLGKSFEKLKSEMDKDDYAREMSIEFLKDTIDKAASWGHDESGYWIKIKGHNYTPEEVWDRFI